MRLGVVSIIAALILVIAGQSVLFLKMQQDNKVMLDSLNVKIESLAAETMNNYKDVNGEQTGMGMLLEETIKNVNEQSLSIQQLQELTGQTQVSVSKLLKNECTPETAIYVLTRDMVAVCRSLGVQP